VFVLQKLLLTPTTPTTPQAMSYRLLGADEPSPVIEYRRDGRSPFVIAVDHAGRRIPKRLGDLGLPTLELARHTAWDIGALEVAKGVSAALDAPLLAQEYSRLVIDCNRTPGSETSIPTMAESLEVPGNLCLSEEETAARRVEIFEPYHARLRAVLHERRAAQRPTFLVTQHTMTDILKGARRAMHAAVLYDHDRRFAGVILEMLRRNKELMIAENEPYLVQLTHYTIPHHAEPYGLPYVELEIRQDLVSDETGQAEWAHHITAALQSAEPVYYARFRVS
jgi:predicted N-formylglutamate amidohydrolase